ncbi:hypothetical protein [Flavobacteriaceae bacterium 14752]|uniref:hypothetical protein n=1 Tax=Mesohalobacter salilacus TaxID=2491711 RepID=UPI000F633CFE|nr:hypothetical protein EIG84_10530 [Flavobacteriaceae bacterium 14752]
MKLRAHFIVALIYFLLVAVLGFVLRLEATSWGFGIPTDYRHVVHAHSHIGLLGWVYLGFSSIIVYAFVDKTKLKNHYSKIFWATQICLLGMLISFPLQGYALFSIIFSTLFLLVSYVFFGFILKHTQAQLKSKKSFILIKHSLFYMAISSIGPWALGGIMSTLGNTSVWYKLAIYFYLHFQYNAWFVLAALGVLVFLLEQSKLKINDFAFKIFVPLIHIGIISSFFLSCLWANSHWSLFLLSNLGSVALWIGLYYFWLSIKDAFLVFYSKLKTKSKFLLKFLVFCFLIKLLLQSLSGIPYFAKIASNNIDVVIGYLHWFFLGFVSVFLLFLASYLKWIKLTNFSVIVYLLAFISTEFFIFYRANSVMLQWPFIDHLNLYLAIGSFLFVLAISTILIENLKSKSKV